MLQLAYFADDFTGSTDALESLACAGLRTRLFLNPPTVAQCAGLDAIGVAGLTRSLAPDAMAAELRPAFAVLRALAPRYVHYKVCSTFDSSPTAGSIGRAIDVGAEMFPGHPVPLLVAAPALGRYCVFGELYARFGIGSAGAIYRLDRHPAISQHPVTPMTEADFGVHLAQQTKKRIGLLNVTDLELPFAESLAAFDAIIATGNEVVLFDALNESHLRRAGALMETLANGRPLFSVGSSGIEAALTLHWTGPKKTDWPPLVPAQPLLVVSGSCSAVTVGQIDWALANGFVGVKFEGDRSTGITVAALKSGQSVVVYSNRGEAGAPVPASVLGTQLGQLARDAVAQTGLKRLVIAGGDTSSYAGRALGIESLEMLAPLAPGAPLCRAAASASPVDGIEINFKGGQVGAPDYFGTARGKI
ncbi:MAG TPA: four-carbon acid sugar kinase family protein [Lacunisphaera sp.]|jgi:uncharacterized protein YgbK (DUF1537 family)